MRKKYINIFIVFILIIIILITYYIQQNINIFKNIKEYKYKINELKRAIEYNEPIEEKLNVIVVISNPCLYKRRYELLKNFIERMNKNKYIIIYIVELIYNNQKFAVTDKNNPNHLQLTSKTPLWHKENMINLGVKYLLPKDYKAFAWIDADIEFENKSWAIDTLKILNGTKDVVQLFSHAILLDKDESINLIYSSAAYNFIKFKKCTVENYIYWNPGFAWAITKEGYDKIGGLYDKAIIGGGDSIMMRGFINIESKNFINYNLENISNYEKKCKELKFGYIQGIIKHYYHGTKENRKYRDRYKILYKYNYNSDIHLKYNDIGLLIPTDKFPEDLRKDILNYFKERKEDD
jgi:hypothetical protein